MRADREVLGRTVGGEDAGHRVAERGDRDRRLPSARSRSGRRSRSATEPSCTPRSSSSANFVGLDVADRRRPCRRSSSCRCPARWRSSTSGSAAIVRRHLRAEPGRAEVLRRDHEVAAELLADGVVDRGLHRRGEHGEQRHDRDTDHQAPTRSRQCGAGCASRSSCEATGHLAEARDRGARAPTRRGLRRDRSEDDDADDRADGTETRGAESAPPPAPAR